MREKRSIEMRKFVSIILMALLVVIIPIAISLGLWLFFIWCAIQLLQSIGAL